jgi:hypothetical protein
MNLWRTSLEVLFVQHGKLRTGYGGHACAHCAQQRIPDQLLIEAKTNANQGLNGFGRGRDDPPLFCQQHHSQRSLDRNRENPSTLAGLGIT